MHHLRVLGARSLEQLLVARAWVTTSIYSIGIYVTDVSHLYISIWRHMAMLHLHLHLHLLLHLLLYLHLILS